MKREDLRKIEGLSDEMINQIMSLHQTDVASWNERIASQNTAIADRDTIINTLNAKVSKYDGIDIDKLQKDFSDLQNKYNADMTAKDRKYAKEKLFDGYKWTSSLARQGAMLEFDSKNLEFKDGKFEKADDFFNALKTSNPDAFGDSGVGSTGFDHGDGNDLDGLSGVEKAFYSLNPQLKK